ncbi:hypothetical protein B5808_15590 [Cnuibacter physcomitrellae]|uniref:FHA domain-containing protein n=1 Tax=Cnuibacter physcomitrellae TaxID=1619308 RepID=A0A1X9LTH5_9MICO|nr:FHA domain-containing protein [Cnuibacter physcomitrellae]ARJ06479.1 hypothetical protein B5808_15590 [Cnuibacter physcomitrellae]
MTWFGIVIAIVVMVVVLVVVRRRSKGFSGRGTIARRLWSWVRGGGRDIADLIAREVVGLAHPVLGELGAPEFVYVRASLPEATVLERDSLKTTKVVLGAVNRGMKVKSERMGLPFVPVLSISVHVEVGDRDVVASFVPLEEPFGSPRDEDPVRYLGMSAFVPEDGATEEPARVQASAHDTVASDTVTEEIPTWVSGDIPTSAPVDIPTMPAVDREPGRLSTIDLTLSVPGLPDVDLIMPAFDGRPITIGRSASCDLRLPEMPGLSNRHLLVERLADGVVARDVSRWGTFVRDAAGRWSRLSQDTPLPLGEGALLGLDGDGFVTVTVKVTASESVGA